MNKVIYVEAFFKEGKGNYGLIDGKRLSSDIASAVASLNQENYEVVTVLPVISGDSKESFMPSSRYGFSYTEGVSIIAKYVGEKQV